MTNSTMTEDTDFRDDHDSPWKEALEHYFPEFLSLLFPSIHAEIDWTRRFEFLDHELQQVVGDAELGRRYADKLVKVFTQEGRETWVLIHVEVQGTAESDFAERMFVYYYRLFDRYHVDVISVAVLTDDSPSFHPDHYRRERGGCVVEFRFPTQKLLEWEPRWTELEASSNPFSLVVLAHLKARATRDGESRKDWKLRLIRLMYERGYGKVDVLELFRVIDWILRLPPALEQEFLKELYTYEKAQQMPYITSAERFGRQIGIELGREQGREQGLEQGREEGIRRGEATLLLRLIELRFGAADQDVIRRIHEADSETLLHWSDRILTAQSLSELLE